LAVAVVEGSEVAIHLDPGADALTESTRFDVGSVAKTFTALLLAQLVVAGEFGLDEPIGGHLDAGPNGAITFLQLATHTSGLPRLPPNLMTKAAQSPDDPYRDYTPDDLLEALRSTPATPGDREYSNFGYMVLGAALAAAGGAPYGTLLGHRVLEPLRLRETGLGFDGVADRAHGYAGAERVPDWTLQVPGPGGMTSCIADMARYVRANLAPDETPLETALVLAQRPFAWVEEGDVLWHNGGAGGFGAMVAFDRGAGRGIAVLAGRPHSLVIDEAALRALRAPPA
jgi:serine-type D-Ala-D-Ala carboxypeptidase/endopeptidase